MIIPFSSIEPIDQLIDLIWTTYEKLTPARNFLTTEAKSHSEAMYLLNKTDSI